MIRIPILVIATATALLATGCNMGEVATSSSPAAVKVNGDTISVDAIRTELAARNLPPEQAGAAEAQVLERMIDQQLLQQKALHDNLDSDPKIAIELGKARKAILAKAYVDKAVASLPKPGPDEINAYYSKNPALFEQRRIYRFLEMGAGLRPEQYEPMKKATAKATTLDELRNWLNTQRIPHSEITESTRTSEQLPPDLLPQLGQMRDGQILVFPGQGRVTILQLAQSRNVPLSLEEATPMIEQYFEGKMRNEIGAAEVKKLREAARLEYFGEHARSKPAAPANRVKSN